MTFFENRRHLAEAEPSSEERCSRNLQRHLFAPARSARLEPRPSLQLAMRCWTMPGRL